MTHHHYLALVEFHTVGDDDVRIALREKLKSLSESDMIQLRNIVPVFRKV